MEPKQVPLWSKVVCSRRINSDDAARRIALCEGSGCNSDSEVAEIRRQQRLFI